jgi:phage terminase large subunit-like protein
MATSSKGLKFLRRAMQASPEIREELVVLKQAPSGTNARNLTAGYHGRVAAELGEDALNDEDIDMRSPFAGLRFDEYPIRVPESGVLEEIAIGVDPADGKGRSHDDWGIFADGRRADGHYVALEDASGDFDDGEAGKAVLALYDRWRGRAKRIVIVVEKNRGPRAETAIRNGYLARELERLEQEPGAARQPMPELVLVYRDKDKRITYLEVRPLYVAGLLHHVAGLAELEAQMVKCDPDDKRPKANDRIDGHVTGVFYLAKLHQPKGVDAEQLAAAAAAQCQIAARMNEALAGGAAAQPREIAPGILEPMKVAGAPPGDARAPAPRTVGRFSSWKTRTVF